MNNICLFCSTFGIYLGAFYDVAASDEIWIEVGDDAQTDRVN